MSGPYIIDPTQLAVAGVDAGGPGDVTTPPSETEPQFTAPVAGTVLDGTTATLSWEANETQVDEWWVYVGSTEFASDIYDSGNLFGATTVNATGLPDMGERLYLTLWYKVAGSWERRSPSRFVYAVNEFFVPPTGLLGILSQTQATAARSAGYLSTFVGYLPQMDSYLQNTLNLDNFTYREHTTAIVGVPGHLAVDAAYRVYEKMHGLRHALTFAHEAGETADAIAIAAVIKNTIDLYLDNLLVGHDPNGHITGSGYSQGQSGVYYPYLASARGLGSASIAMEAMHRAGIETAWVEAKLASVKAFLDANYQSPGGINSYGTRFPHNGGGWHSVCAVAQGVYAVARVLGNGAYSNEHTAFVAQMKMSMAGNRFNTDTGHGNYVMGILIPTLEAQLRGENWWATTWSTADISDLAAWFIATRAVDGGGYTGSFVGQYATLMSLSADIASAVPVDGSTYNDFTTLNSGSIETLGSATLGGGLNIQGLSASLVPDMVQPGSHEAGDINNVRAVGGGTQLMDGLSNLRCGGPVNGLPAIRFRAERGGQVLSITPFWIARDDPGYSGGDGGTIEVSVLPIDGNGNPDIGATPISTGTHVPVLVNGAEPYQDQTDAVDMSGNAELVKGEVYGILFRNIDSNPDVNYISINTSRFNFREGETAQRWKYWQDAAPLWSTDLSTYPSGVTFEDFAKPAAPNTIQRVANFMVVTTQGAFGQARTETGNVTGRRLSVTSSVLARTRIVPELDDIMQGWAVNTAFIVGGSATVELSDGEDNVIDSHTISDSANIVVDDSDRALMKWYEWAWPNGPHETMLGSTYYVTYRPQGSAQLSFATARDFREPSRPGYVYPAIPTEHAAQSTRDGGTWKNYHHASASNTVARGTWRDVALMVKGR